MKLAVTTVGQGPDLVLLHGWGMNGGVWAGAADRLADRYRLSILDLPGHGASTLDGDHADLATWADALVAAAPRRASWLGWSLGGQLALRVALDHPARVRDLTLVATTPRFLRSDDWPHAMAPDTLAGFKDALLEDPRRTLARFLAKQVRGADEARENLRVLKAAIGRREPASPRGLAQGLDLLLHTDLREELASLQCPSLWLFGERDTLVPARVSDYIGGLIPDARVAVVEGAAHAPLLSHPQPCEALIHSFLEAA
ncbi:MAG: pimeloyl-ACP methyl ester esterase BioH [Pseudomonadota bacterium]